MAFRFVRGGCRALMAAKSSNSSAPSSSSPQKKPFPFAIFRAVTVSPVLADFVGASEVSRGEAVKKIWEYIKLHNLQNPTNKREVFCDVKLKTIFQGREKVRFIEIAKLVCSHVVETD